VKRRGLFLSDLPSAEWIQYVRDLEEVLQAAQEIDMQPLHDIDKTRLRAALTRLVGAML
jgi:hypothetical protein